MDCEHTIKYKVDPETVIIIIIHDLYNIYVNFILNINRLHIYSCAGFSKYFIDSNRF